MIGANVSRSPRISRPPCDVLYGCGTDADREQEICRWLSKHRPCLFGRIAAQRGLLRFSFITLADVTAGDQAVRNKVQEDRRRWRADAEHGLCSGFVIAVLLPQLATAVPDQTVLSFAQHADSHP